jgi:hypothetical protein
VAAASKGAQEKRAFFQRLHRITIHNNSKRGVFCAVTGKFPIAARIPPGSARLLKKMLDTKIH